MSTWGSDEVLHEWSVRLLHESFLAQPPDVQAATLARVQRLIRRHPRSALAKLAKEVYTAPAIDPLDAFLGVKFRRR